MNRYLKVRILMYQKKKEKKQKSDPAPLLCRCMHSVILSAATGGKRRREETSFYEIGFQVLQWAVKILLLMNYTQPHFQRQLNFEIASWDTPHKIRNIYYVLLPVDFPSHWNMVWAVWVISRSCLSSAALYRGVLSSLILKSFISWHNAWKFSIL